MLALLAWPAHWLLDSGTLGKLRLPSSPLSLWLTVLHLLCFFFSHATLNMHKNKQNRIRKPHGPIIQLQQFSTRVQSSPNSLLLPLPALFETNLRDHIISSATHFSVCLQKIGSLFYCGKIHIS